VNKPII